MVLLVVSVVSMDAAGAAAAGSAMLPGLVVRLELLVAGWLAGGAARRVGRRILGFLGAFPEPHPFPHDAMYLLIKK